MIGTYQIGVIFSLCAASTSRLYCVDDFV